jgi:hypothetical protein
VRIIPLCLIGAFTVAELPLSAEAVAAQGDRQAATTAQQWPPDPHYAYPVITGIEKSAYAFLEGIAHGAQLEEAIRAARRIARSFDSAATQTE